MKTFFRTWCLLSSAALSSACDDPLKPLELVEDLRVLGARAEVEGDPGRAAPSPGENTRVRWLVAAPETAPNLGWAFGVCVAASRNTGTPECDGEPFASATSPELTAAEPDVSFAVPSGLDLTRASSIAVLGSICEGALPVGEPAHSRCPSGAPGTRVSFELGLRTEPDVNLNPRFAEPGLFLDEQPWTGAPTFEEPCAGGPHPSVRAGSGKLQLQIVTASDARDPLTPRNEIDPERESLLISHFSTGGELDRAFSNLGASNRNESVAVGWAPPAETTADGVLVRFWFVLRDERGGADFAERAVCVVP